MHGEQHLWIIGVAVVIAFGVIGWVLYPGLKEQRPPRLMYAAGIALFGVFIASAITVVLAVVALWPAMWIKHLITGH